MVTVHLLHGFVGSGKTTFAKKLAHEISAIRLTPDEWMTILHGTNPPAESFRDNENRIVEVIWKLTEQCVSNGIDVIIDFGFWTKASRDEAIEKVMAMGAEAKLYKIFCSDEICKARVLQRTAEMPEGALMIDENAIEEFRLQFEPINPTEEECICIDTS